jgi:predicted nucleotidyltransferase
MLSVPQGLTAEQFSKLSAKVRAAVSHLGNDVCIQGSRAKGTAGPDSDLDVAIRVSPGRFEQLLVEGFGTPNPGSAKEKTMKHAAA